MTTSKLIQISRLLFGFSELDDIPIAYWGNKTPNELILIIHTLFDKYMNILDERFCDFWTQVENVPCGYINKAFDDTKILTNYDPNGCIFGITGQKYNGKDTIANYLRDSHGYTQVAFADALKDICGVLFDFNYDQLYGCSKEVPDSHWFGITPRTILQYVGTEIFRTYDEAFWIKCVENKINRKKGLYVISDVRFQNELDMIKQHRGCVIRVVRPNIVTSDLHSSETNILSFSVKYEIINNGTVEELYRSVDAVLDCECY